jgi:hypothetical protein
MRLSTVFWGCLLILSGVLFLLNTLGILQVSAWEIIIPLFLISLGGWILLGVLFKKRAVEHVELPLNGASQAQLVLNHGAGRLSIGSGVQEGSLLEGDFGGGVLLEEQRYGDRLQASLSMDDRYFGAFFWGAERGLDWKLRFSEQVPIDMELKTGASENRVDLYDLQVSRFRLNTGASSTELRLPAHGFTVAEIHSGAASISVRIPENVAARIRYRAGAASVVIDTVRFPHSAGLFQSDDYEIAVNKVDLSIDMGAGSVQVS